MMPKTSNSSKRTFTREYKLEVLELARTSGKSKAPLERELGLTAGQIGNWEMGESLDAGSGASASAGCQGWTRWAARTSIPKHRPPERS